MRINWEQRDGAAIARIEGRIDSSNTMEFERVLESGLNPTAKTVVMDFEKVAFMSSAGLRVVLMLAKQLRKPPILRGEIDFDVVGDNLKDIAGFTIEKYEYINECTLSEETREKVLLRINDALWRRVEELKRERMLVLKEMFIAASKALDDVVTTGSK